RLLLGRSRCADLDIARTRRDLDSAREAVRRRSFPTTASMSYDLPTTLRRAPLIRAALTSISRHSPMPHPISDSITPTPAWPVSSVLATTLNAVVNPAAVPIAAASPPLTTQR